MRRKSAFGCPNFAALAARLAGIWTTPHAGPSQFPEQRIRRRRPAISKLLRVCAIPILILPFCVVPGSGAKANIMACFKALAPIDEASKAAEVSAKAAACMSQASGDPMMAMTIAALSAGAVSGKFSDIDTCKAMVDGAVGTLIAEALLTILPDGAAKDLLTQFVQGKTPLTFKEILNGIDFLKPVLGYIECGCDVAGAPGEYAAIAKKYAADVSECGSFVGDAANWFIDGAGSVAGSIAGELNHGGGQMTVGDCPRYVMPDNIWTKTKIYVDIKTDYWPGYMCTTVCKKGSYILEKVESGTTYYECTAKCPDPVKTSDGTCSYQSSYTPTGGICAPSGSYSCCSSGHKVIEWGVCSPACTPGAEYWNTVDNKCESCSAGTKSNGAEPCIPCANNGYVSLSQYAGQKGACQVCEPWRKVSYSALGFGSCEDRCPNGVYVDPNPQPPSGGQVQQNIKLQYGSPAKNVTSLPQQSPPSSPTDEVANPPGLSGPLTPSTAGPVELVKIPFCIACGSNEYSANNQCHACGPNAVVNIAARSCTSCEKGQIAKLINGAPTCAADCSKVFGGKKRGISTNYITDSKNLSHCVACVAGTRPNATHTACLGTPALSSKPILPLPGGDTTRKKKKFKGEGTAITVKMNCPPRTHPNTSGTGCLPDLDIPGLGGVGTTAPSRSGGATGTPALIRGR